MKKSSFYLFFISLFIGFSCHEFKEKERISAYQNVGSIQTKQSLINDIKYIRGHVHRYAPFSLRPEGNQSYKKEKDGRSLDDINSEVDKFFSRLDDIEAALSRGHFDTIRENQKNSSDEEFPFWRARDTLQYSGVLDNTIDQLEGYLEEVDKMSIFLNIPFISLLNDSITNLGSKLEILSEGNPNQTPDLLPRLKTDLDILENVRSIFDGESMCRLKHSGPDASYFREAHSSTDYFLSISIPIFKKTDFSKWVADKDMKAVFDDLIAIYKCALGDGAVDGDINRAAELFEKFKEINKIGVPNNQKVELEDLKDLNRRLGKNRLNGYIDVLLEIKDSFYPMSQILNLVEGMKTNTPNKKDGQLKSPKDREEEWDKYVDLKKKMKSPIAPSENFLRYACLKDQETDLELRQKSICNYCSQSGSNKIPPYIKKLDLPIWMKDPRITTDANLE